ncbi:Lon protease family protein [Dethiobacter alkaliphilus]|uniref:endopeptidase La n=1 Tax=Dethiobacter alkaliphilus AHT 1 TaxID=555088 RepID=C0GHC0_DETAL|nr:ATP-binding protein [Dethiobacter alkaliphilus]EEG77126.1 peptidase S16, lon-like protein [Dethiobacter alkaliphilus AHT 1]
MEFRTLKPEELRYICDPSQFEFETTESVPPLEGIIGQERAVRAMEFGLAIKRHGYNIFMTGRTGTGKISYAQTLVNDVAAKEKAPDDWCYVYNFDSPSHPMALRLPCGQGSRFAKDMEELVDSLKLEIPKAFDADDYEREKAELFKKFQETRSELFEELTNKAKEEGFVLKRESTGFVSVPIIDGKEITGEEFEALPAEKKAEFEEKSNEIQLKAIQVMRRIQAAEREMKEAIKELENKIGLFAVGYLIDDLKERYAQEESVVKYLGEVQNDVLENLDDFRSSEEGEGAPFPWMKKKGDPGHKYQVNLVVDNKDTEGAPVIIETNPTYYNLVGRVEYENKMGMVTTDYTMIKAGSLLKANGGYLILQVRDVLTNPGAWEGMKRILKTREACMENLGEQFGVLAMASLRPQAIPVNVKVILMGNPFLYQALYHYEEDFSKLFKVKADFDTEMDANRDNMTEMASFIATHSQREGVKHFDRTGVASLVEYSSRLADHQQKLSTRFNEIVEIIFEADAWAQMANAEVVNGEHVKKAIEEKNYRSDTYEQKLQEMLDEGTILLDMDGEKVGQVNGLSVLNSGDYVFGRPSRITAVTYLGKQGIINIERETKMSGRIHDKGLLTLSGYLAAIFAQKIPLSISASLTFEQLYSGVEGDSASSTELYAILSSLSELPLRQDIAVTGSVNQLGQIQPIGGATHKVEGFFKACKLKGLTGKQGVMLPVQNIKNLNLSDEVVDAVREGKFHIYPVTTIEEGIEILTGVPAGKTDEEGNYPEDTVFGKVAAKLTRYNELLQKSREDGEEKKDDHDPGCAGDCH